MSEEITNDEMIEMLEQDLSLARKSTASDDWLPEWLLGRVERLDAARASVKERCKEILAHIDAEERALHYKWGRQFQQEIDDRIKKQGGKKKSVKFLTGRAGYRATKGTIIIDNTQEAKRWAVDNLGYEDLVAAISGLNKTPLIEQIKIKEETNEETGEIVSSAKNIPAGCIYYPAADKFYPAPPAKPYLTGSDKSLLETNE